MSLTNEFCVIGPMRKVYMILRFYSMLSESIGFTAFISHHLNSPMWILFSTFLLRLVIKTSSRRHQGVNFTNIVWAHLHWYYCAQGWCSKVAQSSFFSVKLYLYIITLVENKPWPSSTWKQNKVGIWVKIFAIQG